MRLVWLGRALDKMDRPLVPRLRRELEQVFPRARKIVVYDCFAGFTHQPEAKTVLGVEVSEPAHYHTHVVKLGTRRQVGPDYAGWLHCLSRHNVASRILVSLQRQFLPNDRVAIIYEDAYRYFGSPADGQGPESLESVALTAVFDNQPGAESVERVIRQVYADLARCLYRRARTDADGARVFYQARLRKAATRWRAEDWRQTLRRDVLWQLDGPDHGPEADSRTAYLDPFDYVLWALAHDAVPPTLVGSSHGDLHGRNVYVGVQRGEAEYPVVFDYGDMRERNVLVWDFVKLETELKVRLLARLYDDSAARQAVLARADGATAHPDRGPRPVPSNLDARGLRADQIQFAFGFEQILGELTDRIHRLAPPDAATPPGGRVIVGKGCVDRALGLLLRIRQEAAQLLGDGQPGRGARHQWLDEYRFALAAYGVCTAKFNFQASESMVALVSAGVACAQMPAANAHIRRLAARSPWRASTPGPLRAPPHPSYRVPLAHARRAWRQGRTRLAMSGALRRLRPALPHFAHAPSLLREYALLLTETGAREEALALLTPLAESCRDLRDGHSLAQIGRIFKDFGDRALRAAPVPATRVAEHPAHQWYEAAYRHYREAFDFNREVHMAINAATLAQLCDRGTEAKTLAAWVFRRCRDQDLGRLTRTERFWLLASQGEALLLLNRTREARAFYRQALAGLTAAERGMALSARAQAQRLAWALGAPATPVLREFTAFHARGRPKA